MLDYAPLPRIHCQVNSFRKKRTNSSDIRLVLHSTITMIQRSIFPMESELSQLCRSKQWILAAERASSHPDEATPSDDANEGVKSTALAIAIRLGAPLVTIQALVAASRSQLDIVLTSNGSVLHEAFQHQASIKTIACLLQEIIQQDKKFILGIQDDMGRTPLHHLMLRVLQASDCIGSIWNIVKSIALAFPLAIQAYDTDGNSPLLLLLLHHDHRNISVPMDHIHRIVQLLVALSPKAASQSQHINAVGCHNRCSVVTKTTPLTYALLYCRCETIIITLLEASRKAGVNACLTKITPSQETALHVAITLRSSSHLIERLVQMEPSSLLCRDHVGLTPIDWFWIRHVLDTRSTQVTPVMASTRRYLPAEYMVWHKEALDRHNTLDHAQKTQFWNTFTLMIHAAAKATSTNCFEGQPSLLHCICKIPCPLAVVVMALERNKHNVTCKDAFGRLPLHTAAGRSGYSIHVPIGIPSVNHAIEEESPVHTLLHEFPQGARVTDVHCQLPLHFAIEANSSVEVIDDLLRHHPDSLERRDGKTLLFPFLQAVGVETTYTLLKKDPTFCASALCV